MLLHTLLQDEEEFEVGGDVGGADNLFVSHHYLIVSRLTKGRLEVV